MNEIHFCPSCGTYFDDATANNGLCQYCGFDRLSIGRVEEPIPERCEEHPKYEGIGIPKYECRTCWLMHKGYTDNKVKLLSNMRTTKGEGAERNDGK